MPTSIHTLRTTHNRNLIADRAIVDVLELQELDFAPGILTTRELRDLWRASQSQVSRRLSAIDQLGPWRVQVQQGPGSCYWIGQRLKPAPEPPASPRERWQALQQRWQEVSA
jgi:hypothetical protein